MKFIVKLFPEIMIKGTAVKKKMVNQLHDNVLRLLRRIDEQSITTKKYWDKIEVFCDDAQAPAVKQVLVSTPGIEQVWQVLQYEVDTLDDIARYVAQHVQPMITGKTFVVRAKRMGNHTFTSPQLEQFVGEHLYDLGISAGVDLRRPEVTVRMELDHRQLNIVMQKFMGLGGFPLGSQGELLSLMSGGFDSSVASYLSMKRGVKTHFVFFNLGGTAHELGVKQVAFYLWQRFGASHRLKFVSVPFEGVVAELFNSVHPSYMGVMLKRLMLQAAEKIADEMGIDALVTGESVAQVSSQTLRNLAVIDQATNKLVLRPLAMMDKTQIIEIADQIGTRLFAESMPEYCGVISQNPVIAGSFKRTAIETKKFNHAVLDEAVAQAVYLPVDQIVSDVNQQAAVEVVNTPTGEVIIDIRAKNLVQAKPLNVEGLNIESCLTIPFHDLNRTFKTLPQTQAYLLYCDRGVMSQLHAQYLKDLGHHNVKVYRPAE